MERFASPDTLTRSSARFPARWRVHLLLDPLAAKPRRISLVGEFALEVDPSDPTWSCHLNRRGTNGAAALRRGENLRLSDGRYRLRANHGTTRTSFASATHDDCPSDRPASIPCRARAFVSENGDGGELKPGRMGIPVSGDVNQGRKMTVPMREFEGLDAACAREYRIVERSRSSVREDPVAVLLPHPMQCLDARCREGLSGLVETLVQVIAARRRA